MVLAAHAMTVTIQAAAMADQDTASAAYDTMPAVESDVDHVQTLNVLRMAIESLEAAETARAARAAQAQIIAVQEICALICLDELGTAHADRLKACFQHVRGLEPRDCARFIYNLLPGSKTTDAGDIIRLMFRMTIQEYNQYAMEHFGTLVIVQPVACCSSSQMLASSQIYTVQI